MGMEHSDSHLQVESARAPTYTFINNNTNTSTRPPSNFPLLPSLPINLKSRITPPSNHMMSQYSLQAAVNDPDMDDTIPEEVAVTQNATASRATAVPSNRGRGRGRWTRPRNTKVTKPAQQKAPSGRGRRQKVYDNLRVQAAHERTQELKQAFLAISKLVKPAAQEVADRSINELLEDPALYKQVPQYGATKKFLRDRHDETIQQCNDRLQHGLAMAEHVWQAQHQKVIEEYTVSCPLLQLLCSLLTYQFP
jgi:hypothetical protein